MKKKIKAGTTATVSNAGRKFGSNPSYTAAYLDNHFYLFTEEELQNARQRADGNNEDTLSIRIKKPWI